jgi:hypothetical protein
VDIVGGDVRRGVHGVAVGACCGAIEFMTSLPITVITVIGVWARHLVHLPMTGISRVSDV